MMIFDIVSMCLRNLLRRKIRTLLTIVGVVVGTCAIVVMISLGLGMNASQEALLAQMGDLTIIEVYSYGNSKNGKEVVLNDEVMAQIQQMKGVLTATPLYTPQNLSAQLYAGNGERYSTGFYNVVGVYPEAMPLLGYELLSGSWEEAFSSPLSMVVGQYAAYNLRDTRKQRNNRRDPYPDRNGKIADPFVDLATSKLILRLDQQDEKAKKVEYKPKVSAVLKEDWSRGYETSRGMFMAIEDLKKIEADYIKANNIKVDKKELGKYQNAKVKVADMEYVGAVEEAIQAMGFDTYSMETIRKPMVWFSKYRSARFHHPRLAGGRRTGFFHPDWADFGILPREPRRQNFGADCHQAGIDIDFDYITAEAAQKRQTQIGFGMQRDHRRTKRFSGDLSIVFLPRQELLRSA